MLHVEYWKDNKYYILGTFDCYDGKNLLRFNIKPSDYENKKLTGFTLHHTMSYLNFLHISKLKDIEIYSIPRYDALDEFLDGVNYSKSALVNIFLQIVNDILNAKEQYDFELFVRSGAHGTQPIGLAIQERDMVQEIQVWDYASNAGLYMCYPIRKIVEEHWNNKDFIKKSFVSSYGSKFADKLLSCKTQIEVANLLLKKRLIPNYAEK